MCATYHSANWLRRALAFCARLRDAYHWSNSPKEVIPCLVRGLGFQKVVSAVYNARYSATDLWVGDPISRRAASCGPLYFSIARNPRRLSAAAHRYVFRPTTSGISHSRHGVAATCARRRKAFHAAMPLARILLSTGGSPVE